LGLAIILPVLVLLGPGCPIPPPEPPPGDITIDLPEHTSGGPDADIGTGDFERTDRNWDDDNEIAEAGVTDPNPTNMRCRGADYLPVEMGGVETEVWMFKDGECYPKDQFTVRCPEGYCNCMADHWHDTLISLSGKVRFDDGTCGSASIDEMSMFAEIWISPAQSNWMSDKEVDLRKCSGAECLEGMDDVFDCSGGECSVR